jgi:glucokinase
MNNLVLAGDIGGTKTTLALYSSEKGPSTPLKKITYPSSKYAALEDMLFAFLAGKDVKILGACFGIAGPVFGNHAKVTNLPWVAESKSLSQAIGGVPVILLNDLHAVAHAIPHLLPADLDVLNPGHPEKHGAIGVIAPGTGLGEAFLVWTGARYRAYPSEGGHTSFAPDNELELELLRYKLPQYDHISNERICSGIGIPNIYRFLRDTNRYPEPDWLNKKLLDSIDHTPIIVQAAVENQAEICVKALEMFIAILGSEAGNLALKVLATGGIYLGGGIPPRIAPQLKQKVFLERFIKKGRHSPLLANIPVHIILNREVALLGAASRGLEHEWPNEEA